MDSTINAAVHVANSWSAYSILGASCHAVRTVERPITFELRAKISVVPRKRGGYRPAMIMLPPTSRMYESLSRRDPAGEGVFFVGVKTTGVFCRPTCASRTPNARNVEFFGTAGQALHAGYRPCKRCRPMEAVQSAPPWVRRLIDCVEKNPSERITSADLRAMDIEPARASRYFKSRYGMTFSAYCRARRMGVALAEVRGNGRGSARQLRAGFNSESGFRTAFARMFGHTPGRAGDTSCMLARWMETPLGSMLAIASDEGLCLLEFVDRRMLETQLKVLRRRFDCAIVPGDNAHLKKIADELERYFAGTLRRFTVPLVLRGTPFQMKVWKRLMEIPPGETLSYAQMARDIGVRDAQRAVGKANGDNRLAIIIPCHRVIRSDGTLCGYGGGLWRKQWLLVHEQALVHAQ